MKPIRTHFFRIDEASELARMCRIQGIKNRIIPDKWFGFTVEHEKRPSRGISQFQRRMIEIESLPLKTWCGGFPSVETALNSWFGEFPYHRM